MRSRIPGVPDHGAAPLVLPLTGTHLVLNGFPDRPRIGLVLVLFPNPRRVDCVILEGVVPIDVSIRRLLGRLSGGVQATSAYDRGLDVWILDGWVWICSAIPAISSLNASICWVTVLVIQYSLFITKGFLDPFSFVIKSRDGKLHVISTTIQ
jgi:hypothetical protein